MSQHGRYTAFVEACYSSVTHEEAWLRELAAAARAAFDAEWAEGFSFRLAHGTVELLEVSDPSFVAAWLGGHERRLPPSLLPAYADFDVGSLPAMMNRAEIETALRDRPLPRPWVERLDTMVAVQGRSSASSGVMACWLAKRPLAPAQKGYLRKLAAHLRAGARLRTHRPAIEAVLDQAGRVHHAEEPAKDRRSLKVLSRGARTIERARTVRTVETVQTWHALWDGRWTLVDSFDRDGKRWLVARANNSTSASTASLQPRERDVVLGAAAGRSLKLMAYELGLPLGTVASTLSRGMRKLRVRTRAELARLLSPLAPEAK